MLHCYWYYFIVSYSFQVLHFCICGLTINSWQSFEVIDRRVRILRSLSLVVHEFTTQGHFISWRAHLGISIFLRPERKCTALMWSRWFLIFQVVFVGVRSDGEWCGVMRSDGFHGDPLGQWDPCQQNTQKSKHLAPFFAPGPLPCFFANVFVLFFFGQRCYGSVLLLAETLQQLIALIGSLSQVGAARLAINRSFFHRLEKLSKKGHKKWLGFMTC